MDYGMEWIVLRFFVSGIEATVFGAGFVCLFLIETGSLLCSVCEWYGSLSDSLCQTLPWSLFVRLFVLVLFVSDGDGLRFLSLFLIETFSWFVRALFVCPVFSL